MLRAIISFFGATLIYMGFLILNRDLTIALAAALAGLALIAKPALDAVKYLRTYFAAASIPRGPEREQKRRPGKTHLRIVKPEDDDRPTIH
jgi:hypothetical protein